MEPSERYRLIRLANGGHGLHSLDYGETMHPGLGPGAEAESLYVRQLRLAERLRHHRGEFVIWDVGLGGAANALAILNATRGLNGELRLLSFDNVVAPLEFALRHAAQLPYLVGWEPTLRALLERGHASLVRDGQQVQWDLRLADFPSLLRAAETAAWPRPHVISFDPFSPAKNPAMWTLALFEDLFRLLDPARPCVMPTYSRSTMLRITLLLAGFVVGVGWAAGRKEETTIAANTPDLIDSPLDRRWLERARRSGSAEPLHEAVYRQSPLTEATWERLRACSQFQR